MASMILQLACILQMLWSVSALVSRPSDVIPDPSPADSDTSIWPIMFLHIPKCGGNFATTIIRTGCDREGVHISDDYRAVAAGSALPPGCSRSNFAKMESGHNPFPVSMTPTQVRTGAAMFRHPIQRLMSGYFHGRHDCARELHRVAPSCINENQVMLSPECRASQTVTAEAVERYAECVGNCETNLVTGSSCNANWRNQTTLDQHARSWRARDRIRNMGFIGLTNEYDLSVCLFHAKYGGPCVAAEFSNLRPGTQHTEDSDYALPAGLSTVPIIKLLKHELKTYEEAASHFWKDVHDFGVGRSFCQRLCPYPPQVFGINASLLMGESTKSSDFEYDWPGRLSFDVDSYD